MHELVKMILDELNVREFRISCGKCERGEIYLVCDMDICSWEIGGKREEARKEIVDKIIHGAFIGEKCRCEQHNPFSVFCDH